MRWNSGIGNTYKQRSCPLVITTPPASSSRNFAGRNSRPLSSRRGVWVPRNTAVPPPRSDVLHVTPLSSIVNAFHRLERQFLDGKPQVRTGDTAVVGGSGHPGRGAAPTAPRHATNGCQLGP